MLQFGGPLWYDCTDNSPQFASYVEHFNKWLLTHPDGDMSATPEFPSHPIFKKLRFSARKLIYRMMHLDPSKRITIEEALNDPWVKSLEVCNPGDEQSEEQVMDASCKTSAVQADKMGVHRLHMHLPLRLGRTFGRDYDSDSD